MKKILFIYTLFILGIFLNSKIAFSQNNIVFQDNFEDNKNEWGMKNDPNFYSSIYNGSYLIKCRKKGMAWWEYKAINFNPTQDFLLESNMRQFEGNITNGYGFAFGVKDNKNFYTFVVNGQGAFKVAKWENGIMQNLKDWTSANAYILPLGKNNKLGIRKQDKKMYFYVNDNLVYAGAIGDLFGNNMGFIVYDDMGIAVNDILLKNNENSNAQTLVMLETFADNANNWKIVDNEISYTMMDNGFYVIQRKKETGSSFYTSEAFFDKNSDYEIESSLRQLNGITNHGFGLVWGMSDTNNFNAFIVNSNGAYSIYYYKEGQIYEVKSWTNEIDKIFPLGKLNKLKIKRIGSNVAFFVNDKLVYTSPMPDFLGTKVGFVVHRNMVISADNFAIRQSKASLPPSLTWLEPSANNSTQANSAYTVRVGVKSVSSIVSANLYINDRAINFERADPNANTNDPTTANNFDLVINKNILLKEGANTIKVIVGNQNGEMTTDSRTIYLKSVNKTPPMIVWTTPNTTNSSTSGSTLKIHAGVTSVAKITKITVSVNDKVLTNRGFDVVEEEENSGLTSMVDREIPLVIGQNKITIAVENENGATAFSSRNVTRNAEEMAFQEDPKEEETHPNANTLSKSDRTDYALFFATDDYDQWSDLINPVNDANTIAKELTESYGFKVEVVRNANRNLVMSKLKEYATKTYKPEDQLMIFFAGHGKFDEAFGEGYVVCKDSEKNDEGNASYLAHSVLRTIANNIPSQHTLLMMDVCFGGTFDPIIAKSDNRGNEDAETTQTEFVKRKMRFKTRKYLTSGGKEYVPDGRPNQHSPFARKFLEALRNYGGTDKILTLGEILQSLERIQPEPRFGEFGNNEPGSDFIFIAR
ncbi:MAG: caspase family protein [Bacteroidetes bacterium]|nr:MAG: caspase family protein [Bacteroidota bacterium]